MADNAEEVAALQAELQWLLKEEVHSVLEDIQHTLLECCSCFPVPVGVGGLDLHHDDQVQTRSHGKHLLTSSSASPGQSVANSPKCVISIAGDSITEADITLKQKPSKDNHVMNKFSIRPTECWKLQQIQDAANHLQQAVEVAERRDKNYVFKSADEVIKLLDSIMGSVQKSYSSLSVPKRKSLYELLHSKNMHIFQPPMPSDVALSFYIHGSKVIMGIYYLHTNGRHKLDITSRLQMECVVQWLNEALICFTLALQQCQQLKDKISTVCMYDGVNPRVNKR